MKSKLQQTLEKNSKVITAELMPPRGGDPIRSLKIAQLLKDKVHAVNITDGSRAIMRMCSLAMSKLLLENGIEPIMQISCRDRNKIALQSDILGANALGIKNILCITGDSVKAGDQQETKAVHEFEAVRLLQQIQAFNQGIDPLLKNFPIEVPISFQVLQLIPIVEIKEVWKGEPKGKKRLELDLYKLKWSWKKKI